MSIAVDSDDFANLQEHIRNFVNEQYQIDPTVEQFKVQMFVDYLESKGVTASNEEVVKFVELVEKLVDKGAYDGTKVMYDPDTNAIVAY